MKAVIFANSTNEKITVYPELELNGKSLAVCREGLSEAEFPATVPAVTLAPRSSEVWLIGDREKVRPEAAAMAEALHKIATFTSER